MRIIVFLILSISYLFALTPFNSNILVVRGIDPEILNTTISSTRQNVAYKMTIDHHLTKEEERDSVNYFLIVDPYASYGIDMRLQVSKEDMEDIDERDVKKTLDELMGVQLYLQEGDLYDKESLKIKEESHTETIITFDFNRDALPRELKHIREMKGFVYVVNGLLEKIVVKNSSRFKMRGIEVDSYEKVVFFTPVAQNGGYLISKETLDIRGTYNALPYNESLTGKVVEYWNINKKAISFDEGTQTRIVTPEDKRYETISVNLDRTFPLLGKEARKAGFDLPKPFGVSLINMFQDTTMHMTSFEINDIPIDFNKVIDGDSLYRSLTYAPLIRADMWLLPFLNVGVILGGTDTTTNVTLVSDSGLSIPPIIPGNPDHVIIEPGATLNLDPFTTNSLLYGVGVTVAGGIGNYFTTIDFQYITAYTSEADVSIDMLIMTPLIGYTFTDYGTRIFIGAQYQDLQESLTFDITTADGTTLSGEVGLQSEEWAGVIGTDYTFTRNWSGNLLYSQGEDRKNVILAIGYRF